jgi:esterase
MMWSAGIQSRRRAILFISSLLLVGLTSSTCFCFVERPQQERPQVANTASTGTSHRATTSTSTTLLQQSSITTSLQKQTISLQWTDFHTVDDSQHPPLVLLHGLLGSKRNFVSLAKALGNQLEKPRRIVGLDLRNHGENTEHTESMSYHEMAHDVLRFLDSQNLRQVVLCGHSMGGKVAQALSLLQPHRVAGLVCLDIAPVLYTSEDPHWKAVEDILHAMQRATTEKTTSSSSSSSSTSKSEMDKQLRQAIPDPALRAFVLTNYGTDRWKIPLAEIVHSLESIAGFDIAPPFHEEDDGSASKLGGGGGGGGVSLQYEGDVFIIHGGQSRFVRHAYIDQIAAFFPNHMLTTIRQAGHWVHAEAPDDTAALLKRYLDR